MVNAADAVVSTHGFRLRGKTGSHEARSAFPALPSAFREQANLIAAARKAATSRCTTTLDVSPIPSRMRSSGRPNRAAVDGSPSVASASASMLSSSHELEAPRSVLCV